MLLAPNTPVVASVTLTQRIQTKAAEKRSQLAGLATTVSLEVATFDPSRSEAVDSAGLTKAADEALYDAKRAAAIRSVPRRLPRTGQVRDTLEDGFE